MAPWGTIDPVFYRRWIVANGWAEGVGLGTTFVLGRLAAPWLERSTGLQSVLLGAVVAVLLGTVLEGVVVGAGQEAVLRRRLLSLPRHQWVVATAIGAGLAWLLGMIPSTVMALSAPVSSSTPPPAPPAALVYLLAFALGAVTGPVLGLAQWVVLRAHVPRAGRWLWANALAWAIGMPLIFLGMEFVPWAGPGAAVFPAIYAVCGAVGLVVGAVHGQILVRLLPGSTEREISR